MEYIQIRILLQDIESKIEHLRTPELRAQTILQLLQVEHTNFENNFLNKVTRFDFIEKLTEMDKDYEVRLSIEILTYYLASNSFGLIAGPIPGADNSMVEKFDWIKNRLQEIVEKSILMK